MGPVKLSDIILTPLSHIETQRGAVLHAMKVSDSGFSGFGEAYFSWIDKDKVKAWKRHREMVLNVVVPVGNVRFVFSVPNSNGLPEYRVVTIGVDEYKRITVPPGIWFGFQGLHAPQSLVLNMANIEHNPVEVEQADIQQFDFDWDKFL